MHVHENHSQKSGSESDLPPMVGRPSDAYFFASKLKYPRDLVGAITVGFPKDVGVWRGVFAVRSLVLEPRETRFVFGSLQSPACYVIILVIGDSPPYFGW